MKSRGISDGNFDEERPEKSEGKGVSLNLHLIMSTKIPFSPIISRTEQSQDVYHLTLTGQSMDDIWTWHYICSPLGALFDSSVAKQEVFRCAIP